MAGFAGPGFFSRAIRSCQTGAVSVRAICTCVTTSGDRIDEINCEKNAFILLKAIAAAGFFCRRSRSAAVAIGCAACQGTDI